MSHEGPEERPKAVFWRGQRLQGRPLTGSSQHGFFSRTPLFQGKGTSHHPAIDSRHFRVNRLHHAIERIRPAIARRQLGESRWRPGGSPHRPAGSPHGGAGSRRRPAGSRRRPGGTTLQHGLERRSRGLRVGKLRGTAVNVEGLRIDPCRSVRIRGWPWRA